MQKALEPILGLRITADEIEAAWKEVCPYSTADRAEAFLLVAIKAVVASLRVLEKEKYGRTI